MSSHSLSSSIEEQKHDYGLKSPRCYYCDEEIWFHSRFEHENGTPIPLDIDRDKSGHIVEHMCLPRRRKMLQRSFTSCYNCNKQITFEKSIRSRTGKLIPCEFNEKLGDIVKHNCGKSPGYRHSVAQRHRRNADNIPKSYESTLLKQETQDWAFKEKWK